MSVAPLYQQNIKIKNRPRIRVGKGTVCPFPKKKFTCKTPMSDVKRTVISQQKSDNRSLAKIVNGSLLFGLVTLSTWCFCCLVGHTLMEKARREGIRAIERTREMKTEVTYLRNRVDKYSDMAIIDQWAYARGFNISDSVQSRPKPKPEFKEQNIALSENLMALKDKMVSYATKH